MTTTLKLLVTAVGATGIVPLDRAHRASQLPEETRALRQQQVSLAGQIQQLQRERDDALKRLALLTDENAALKDDSAQLGGLREEVSQLKAAVPSDAIQSGAKSWLERVTQLKQRME